MYNNFDQAAGLRRLLLRNQTQIITVVAGKNGIGRTSAVINFACALSQAGKDVLVLDENLSSQNVLNRLGLRPQFDLLDITVKRCQYQQALCHSSGFSVLSTARTMKALHRFGPNEQQSLEQTLSNISEERDILLVDAAMLVGQAAVGSSLASGATLMLIVEPSSRGITDSYALIKQLVLNNARYQFQIVINRAPNAQIAQTIFNNMATVARHKLGARLEYLGFIAEDEKLQRASQLGRAVVDTFPNSIAAQQFRALSEKLLHLPVDDNQNERDLSQIMRKLMIQLRSKQTAHVIN